MHNHIQVCTEWIPMIMSVEVMIGSLYIGDLVDGLLEIDIYVYIHTNSQSVASKRPPHNHQLISLKVPIFTDLDNMQNANHRTFRSQGSI